jgi:hypothetical protein
MAIIERYVAISNFTLGIESSVVVMFYKLYISIETKYWSPRSTVEETRAALNILSQMASGLFMYL